MLQAETEDQLYDSNSDLIDLYQDLQDFDDDSDLAKDILRLNQSLLTGGHNVEDLVNKRKIRYANEKYDNFEFAINLEEKSDELENTWKRKIDSEIDQQYLTSPRSLEKLHQLRRHRMDVLNTQPVGKRPPPDDPLQEYFPTRITDRARKTRNYAGNVNAQISSIVDEYKKTLRRDDRKQLTSRIKNDHVKKMIHDAYEKSRNGKSLLDAFYDVWILGAEDKDLLAKSFTKKRIDEARELSKNIDNYVWLISKKRIRGTERIRLPPNPNYQMIKYYPKLIKNVGFSLNNPLGFMLEVVDNRENVELIMAEYKRSLQNPSEISAANFQKIEETLVQGISKYDNDSEKKEYLQKVFDILISRKLNDVEDDDDIDNMFDSFDFLF